MSLRESLLISAFAAVLPTGLAQASGTVAGQVIDTQTRQPLAGALRLP